MSVRNNQVYFCILSWVINKSIFRCHYSNVCFYLPCWISKYKGSFGVFCCKLNFALPIVNFPQYYVVVFFHLKLFLFPLIFIEHRNSTNWNRHTHTHRTPVPTLDFPIPYYGPIHAYCSSVTDGHNQKWNSVDQGPTNIPSFPLSI